MSPHLVAQLKFSPPPAMPSIASQVTQSAPTSTPIVIDGSTIVVAGAALILGIAGWGLKLFIGRTIDQMDKTLHELRTDVAGLRKEMSDIRDRAGRENVARDEYVQTFTLLEAKLDSMHRRQDELVVIMLNRKEGGK